MNAEALDSNAFNTPQTNKSNQAIYFPVKEEDR